MDLSDIVGQVALAPMFAGKVPVLPAILFEVRPISHNKESTGWEPVVHQTK